MKYLLLLCEYISFIQLIRMIHLDYIYIYLILFLFIQYFYLLLLFLVSGGYYYKIICKINFLLFI
jgi:hypothetical protein